MNDPISPITPEVADLLAAVVDALDVPLTAPGYDRQAAADLLRDRVSYIRGVIGGDVTNIDPVVLAGTARRAAVQFPVTYPTYQRPAAEGGER